MIDASEHVEYDLWKIFQIFHRVEIIHGTGLSEGTKLYNVPNL